MKNNVRFCGVMGMLAVCLLSGAGCAQPGQRWSQKQAHDWYAKQPWLVGGNYTPRTAINQLEFWQAESFDPRTIDQELGWAHDIGFNCMRVYLHHIPFQQDERGYCNRIDQFLTIAAKHDIRIMFVLFDDCWDPSPQPGKQRQPKPHVHNSGWVQCPGVEILKNPLRHDEMKPFVQGILKRFGKDPRVFCWDLYNEPGNSNRYRYPANPENKADLSVQLLDKAFDWARQVNPDQPLTVGLWTGNWSDPATMSPINKISAERSDIITFHSYSGEKGFQDRADASLKFGRPVICTEYLNRPGGCTYQALLPYMKQKKIGAINWGLVAGKTQTQYPWASWNKMYTAEPEVWFHDVLRPSGEPFDPAEITLIRELTGRGKSVSD